MKSAVIYLFIVFSFFTSALQAQDTLRQAPNLTDARGLKQGLWLKTDALGRPVYQGTFKDNRPEGEFVYYDSTGKIKARTVFTEKGNRAHSITYYRNGKKAARATT